MADDMICTRSQAYLEACPQKCFDKYVAVQGGKIWEVEIRGEGNPTPHYETTLTSELVAKSVVVDHEEISSHGSQQRIL